MYEVNPLGQLILTDDLKTLLQNVQIQGNRDVTYREDIKTYGVEEKWAYPKIDGFKLVGDCEDIALYKRKLLLDAGVPPGPLLLTICLVEGGGHCVLSVVTDRKDFILCNIQRNLSYPKSLKASGYKFIARQQLGHGINEPWDRIE